MATKDTGGQRQTTRRTEEAEVAAVLKEDDEGIWQVSIRSKSPLNLDRLNYGFVIQRPEIRIRRCQH